MERKVTDYHDFTTKDMPKSERRKIDVGDLWINAVHCFVCGDTVRSRNRHDYRYCKCGYVAVDGGSWYAKRVFTTENFEDIIEKYDDVCGDTV